MPLIASNPLFNLIWFQIFWFTAVLAKHQGIVLLSALLAVHLWLLSERRKELQLMALCAPIGIATDCLLSYFSVFQFTGLASGLIPLWLVGLWLAFSATLRHGMAFFLTRPHLAAVCGAVAGPLSYFAGQRFGAVAFGHPVLPSLMLLCVIWALIFPLFIFITNAVEQRPERKAA